MRPLTIVFLLRTFSLLCNRNESAFQVVVVVVGSAVFVVKNVILVLILVTMTTAIRFFLVVGTSSRSIRDNGGHAADYCLLVETIKCVQFLQVSGHHAVCTGTPIMGGWLGVNALVGVRELISSIRMLGWISFSTVLCCTYSTGVSFVESLLYVFYSYVQYVRTEQKCGNRYRPVRYFTRERTMWEWLLVNTKPDADPKRRKTGTISCLRS